MQVGEAGGFWRERVQRRKALLRRSGGSTLKVYPRAPVATGSGGSFKLRCLTHPYLRIFSHRQEQARQGDVGKDPNGSWRKMLSGAPGTPPTLWQIPEVLPGVAMLLAPPGSQFLDKSWADVARGT